MTMHMVKPILGFLYNFPVGKNFVADISLGFLVEMSTQIFCTFLLSNLTWMHCDTLYRTFLKVYQLTIITYFICLGDFNNTLIS